MEKISHQDYRQGVSYLGQHKNPNERAFFFPYVECVIAEDGHTVYIRDYSTNREKFYQEQSKTIQELYIAVRNLYIRQVTIGMNLHDDHEDVEKLEFVYGPIPFTFKDLREITYSMEKAKYTYNK